MNCPKCQNQNEETAQFCKNCGLNLHYTQPINNGNDTSSILLLVFILIALVSAISQFALQKLVVHWYEGTTKYLIGSIWILQNFNLILPALAIKNKTLKIIGIVLISILIIYQGYTNLEL